MIRPDALIVIILLTMLTALGPITTDLYLPSLPSIQAYFDTDVPTVQLTLSVYLVVFAICQLFYGPMSDRYGRRPVLILGTFIYFLGAIVCLIASSIEMLIAGRMLQALGGCAGIVLARSVVRDVYGQQKSAKMLSYMGTAMALAPGLGPIIGGYLTVAFGWQANFGILVAFGGLCLLGIIFLLQETNVHKDPDAVHPVQTFNNFLKLLSNRTYAGYLLTAAFSYSGLFAFISGSSFVFINVVGLTADQYGYCFAAAVVGYMIGTQIGGRSVEKFGIPSVVKWGTIVSAISGIAMLATAMASMTSVAAILIPMVFYMAGMGMTLPNSMAGAIGPFPKMAGAASSLAGFAQYGIASFVGLGVAHSFDMTELPMATGVATMGVGAMLSCRLVKPAS
ncbi:MAG: multidrug effflux MFS transporter [Gammaproteobacteria bacterium]|nr:multidrug effflux MFS transporter [Aestuariibacter sp.]MCP4430928.1 multidrug effflux MFS transporter [Gammaproteobacteria bacterium]